MKHESLDIYSFKVLSQFQKWEYSAWMPANECSRQISVQIPAAHPHFQLNHSTDLACHLRHKPSQAFELSAPFSNPEPHLPEKHSSPWRARKLVIGCTWFGFWGVSTYSAPPGSSRNSRRRSTIRDLTEDRLAPCLESPEYSWVG
jgi:hypothetical protein